MAKFWCVCGELIRTSGDMPHPYQWSLMSDVDLDTVTGTVDVEELYLRSTLMFRCPACGSLWIYWSGMAELPTLYTPAPPE